MLVEYLTRRWESRPINVFGTGTSLDSWRLRELLAVELGVHPGNVHAWVIGEHGDSAVFPFEAVRIGPFSLAEFGRLAGRPPELRREAQLQQGSHAGDTHGAGAQDCDRGHPSTLPGSRARVRCRCRR